MKHTQLLIERYTAISTLIHEKMCHTNSNEYHYWCSLCDNVQEY